LQNWLLVYWRSGRLVLLMQMKDWSKTGYHQSPGGSGWPMFDAFAAKMQQKLPWPVEPSSSSGVGMSHPAKKRTSPPQ
jgi:hypothetical protein